MATSSPAPIVVSVGGGGLPCLGGGAEAHLRTVSYRPRGRWVGIAMRSTWRQIVPCLGGLLFAALLAGPVMAESTGEPSEPAGEQQPQPEKASSPRVYLGARLVPLTAKQLKQFKLSPGVKHALMVRNVATEGPADEAGLTRGDLILSIDDVAVTSLEALSRQLAGFTPDQDVRFRFVREGKMSQATVTLARTNARQAAAKWRFAEPTRVQGFWVKEDKQWVFRPVDPQAQEEAIANLQQDQRRRINVQVWMTPDGRITTKVVKTFDDGGTLSVEKDRFDRIIVRRVTVIDAGGPITQEDIYPNAEQMRVEDGEAAELYASHTISGRQSWPNVEGEPVPTDVIANDLKDLRKRYRKLLAEGKIDPTLDPLLSDLIDRLAMEVRARERGMTVPQMLEQVQTIQRTITTIEGRSRVRIDFSPQSDGRVSFTVETAEGTTVSFPPMTLDQMQENHPKAYERYRAVLDITGGKAPGAQDESGDD